jgi:dTDP-4-dehydrorhamnose reductase
MHSQTAASKPLSEKPLELWGGVECTINGSGDRFCSQLARMGDLPEEYLERIADLGIRTMRFPLLWEKDRPGSPSPL